MDQSTFESPNELAIGTEIAPLPGQLYGKMFIVSQLLGFVNGKFVYLLKVRDRVVEHE